MQINLCLGPEDAHALINLPVRSAVNLNGMQIDNPAEFNELYRYLAPQQWVTSAAYTVRNVLYILACNVYSMHVCAGIRFWLLNFT